MRTVLFCENDSKCQRVLRKHWPEVPIHDDIATLNTSRLSIDVLAGGFPCQPFSTAARGRNNKPDLWPHMHRIADELRMPWLLAENVPGLGYHGIDRVCSDLERSDYTCWPFRLDTAPPGRHRGRDRFIIVAHSNSQSQPRRPIDAEVARLRSIPISGWPHDAAPVGMDDGLPGRRDALRQLGNSFSPWTAEVFGRAIVAASNACRV